MSLDYSREIKRGACNNQYDSDVACERYTWRRKKSKSQGRWSVDIAKTIVEKLKLTWSPEQIGNTETLGQVTFKTIYNWLYDGKLDISLSALRRKGENRKPAETRGKFAVGTPISKRPKEVKSRETFGHWELDTMVSSRGKNKGCFVTFVERKSRLYTAIKTPDRSSSSIFRAISQLHGLLPENRFKTATTDRGKEFACFPLVEKI